LLLNSRLLRLWLLRCLYLRRLPGRDRECAKQRVSMREKWSEHIFPIG
jgi:hypothetical protein